MMRKLVWLWVWPAFLVGREWRVEERAEPQAPRDEPRLESLYHSLDPLSVPQHLAFYELYPDSHSGKKALKKAWTLLSRGKGDFKEAFLLPQFDIQAIISLITRQPFEPLPTLSEEQLSCIEKLGELLCNRKLKGFGARSFEELLALPSEEIDLGRGLLLTQFGPTLEKSIRQYEASLDLMALQILARLSPTATPQEKIGAINQFIFHEMQFRFPPHSLHAKDIDLYTFLPSVLDNRQGVCLGVSILYLCLAQRLDLPLEIITPPGHIYVRYREGEEEINIETTARGIHLPSDTYLGINTRKLEMRTMKEVLGLSLFNQASVFWGKEDYKTTVALYEKARLFLPHDDLLKMFLGLNYLFVGKKNEGKKLLQEVRALTFDWAVSPETIPDDYLKGKIDAEGIKAVFLPVDENRSSILEKQKQLQTILKRYPHFRAGLLQLVTTWLQLGRGQEALELLERYHKIDPSDAHVEYYLTVLSVQRFDYLQAWRYFRNTEQIVQARSHHPKALKGIKAHLKRVCPTP